MFDENGIRAYRDIKPSDSVKTRILADLDAGIKRKNTEKIILSRAFPLIAACLVLVLSAIFLSHFANRSVMLDVEQGIATAAARSIAPQPITAAADLKLPTEIAVTDGTLTVTDAETGEILGEGNNLRVHGKVIICWHLETESQTQELTLSCLGFKNSYRATDNSLIRTK